MPARLTSGIGARTTQEAREHEVCGIVGCLAMAAGAEPDPGGVRIAVERIHHRGPDDDGFYSDADIALGIKRLAIIDLSAGGRQPMRSADGRYCMVFNGEIYN